MSMALPLCPPHRIEKAFELMQQEVASMSPSVDTFAEEYLDYIRATYMNGNYGTATDWFEWNEPPLSWICCERWGARTPDGNLSTLLSPNTLLFVLLPIWRLIIRNTLTIFHCN